MNRDIWEFLPDARHGVIREWLRDKNISVRDQAKLDLAVDRLRTLDFGLNSTKLVAGPLKGSKVFKLRLRCENRELRPMLCRGPLEPLGDCTLLLGAIERDGKLDPADAVQRAEGNRRKLKEDRSLRARY